MRKILFLVNAGKISPNENGGAAVYYCHLELLYKSGFTINLLALEWDNSIEFKKEDYKEVNDFVATIDTYKVIYKPYNKGIYRFLEAITNPSKFEYNFINKKNKLHLNTILAKYSTDIVWCEWRWSAILAIKSNLEKKVIYAHHDWEYKLAKLRKKRNVLQKFHTFQKERVEINLVKKATACISGSITEKEEIEKISSRKSMYLPTTYKNVTIKINQNKTPNIVHLGGMNTTANRLGLERFLEVCWLEIKNKIPSIKLIVIGSLKHAPSSLLEKLDDSQISCVGFVKDLESVMSPNDIHIVPWEYNTGTRTRIPVVLNYAQVLVATKASVSCYPEITSKNSMLCNNLTEMTTEIINLYFDEERLHLLSKNGKKTFLNSFTLESQQDKIRNFIDNL
jgi:hypothetical protein